jgi:hypothetical protein
MEKTPWILILIILYSFLFHKPLRGDMMLDKAKILHPPPYIQRQIRPALEADDLSSEVVWTYLLAKIYEDKLPLLAEKLCGRKEELPAEPSVWLEAYLYPTRKRSFEGKFWKVRADLALGHLKLAGGRARQVLADGSWICIAESKWLSDIDNNSRFSEVSQLAQLIEHALLLHDDKDGRFPERVYVTLITPAYFKQPHDHFSNMAYYEKYHEYQGSIDSLVRELRVSDFPFIRHDLETLIQRVSCLKLNWVSFDELFGLPGLVETQIPKMYKTSRKTWRQVFSELDRLDLLEELLRK